MLPEMIQFFPFVNFFQTTDFTNFSIIFLDYHLRCIYFDGNKIIFFVYKIGKLKHSFKRMKYLFRVQVVIRISKL